MPEIVESKVLNTCMCTCHFPSRANIKRLLPISEFYRSKRMNRQCKACSIAQLRAYKQTEVATARRLLQDLARRLEDRYPSAAASVREGLDETLTVITLGLSDRLRQSLATTNAIESLISRTRHVKRNVKRWRGGQMVLRWTAAAVLEAVKGFRRLKGHKDMPKLVAALRARDQQLGLGVSAKSVA